MHAAYTTWLYLCQPGSIKVIQACVFKALHPVIFLPLVKHQTILPLHMPGVRLKRRLQWQENHACAFYQWQAS